MGVACLKFCAFVGVHKIAKFVKVFFLKVSYYVIESIISLYFTLLPRHICFVGPTSLPAMRRIFKHMSLLQNQ